MPHIVEEETDDSMDELMIFPLTDIVSNHHEDHDGDDESYEEERSKTRQSRRPSLTLRQRRYSKLGFGNGPLLKLNVDNSSIKQPKSTPIEIAECLSPGRRNWLKAFHLIRQMKDPWECFNINNLPVERALRHRYNALKKEWKIDNVLVKMETESFNRGAMRSCFRLKKLSSFSKCKDWKTALNYVAKKYVEDVDREVYFDDVRLQMDAKLWGEEYNRHRPPKKVDIFQMYVLEYMDRPGRPLYHLEHFIEGDYIKYNSNSGFVDEHLRNTPQAFSHFTFERSGHEMIVVDIQGVGDLWTDPQIHTKDGKEYGDGNLGPKGMALFFHTHSCNSICDSLNLTRFDLAASEAVIQEQFVKKHQARRGTVCRGHMEMVISASPMERSNLSNFLARSRTLSMCSEASESECDSPRPRYHSNTSTHSTHSNHSMHSATDQTDQSEDEYMGVGSPMDISPVRMPSRRIRFLSESDDSASTSFTEEYCARTEEERIRFRQACSKGARPSCVSHEINLRNLQNIHKQEDSSLGMVHHELAKYHDLGRFSETHEADPDAVLFHEQHAADLGIKEAILTMANLYLGIPQDVLTNLNIEPVEDNVIQGVDYMVMAAEIGDRSAMVYLAKAFETGLGLGGDRSQSYMEAVTWYQKAVNTDQDDECGEFDATMNDPVYQLQGKMAELYMKGGCGLVPDPSSAGDYYNEAAEGAMAAMKGRLANKYYALSEEAYSMVEEE